MQFHIGERRRAIANGVRHRDDAGLRGLSDKWCHVSAERRLRWHIDLEPRIERLRAGVEANAPEAADWQRANEVTAESNLNAWADHCSIWVRGKCDRHSQLQVDVTCPGAAVVSRCAGWQYRSP